MQEYDSLSYVQVIFGRMRIWLIGEIIDIFWTITVPSRVHGLIKKEVLGSNLTLSDFGEALPMLRVECLFCFWTLHFTLIISSALLTFPRDSLTLVSASCEV